MSSQYPLAMSRSFGSFSVGTLTTPLPNFSETGSVFFPLDRELLDMPIVIPDSDGLNDDLYWENEAA